MNFKKFTGFIHLWLGLTTGLIVFIISITGCMYAFKTEIEELTQPYRFIKEKNGHLLPPSVLGNTAQLLLPGKLPHSVQYNEPGRSATVSFYQEEPFYYYVAYLHPHTGKVLKLKNMEEDFFAFILKGHFYLWLPKDIGQPVVASATLVFVFMLITGIILWWPKNKPAARQRFWFRWKGNLKWKRKNYDLHNVLGFYASWVLIILAFTGLVWGFQWFSDLAYKSFSGGKDRVQYYEVYSDTTAANLFGKPAIDKIFMKLRAESPKAKIMELHFPHDRKSAIETSTNVSAGTYWQADYRNFDQYSLKELEVKHTWGRIKNASVADKVARMNYDIHVGAVIGLPGKCLAFLASLIAASLPVSGFLIWWGRNKSKARTSGKRHSCLEATLSEN